MLKEVQATFGGDPRFALISLVCAQDAAEAEKAIQKNGLSATYGLAGDLVSGVASRYKIKAIPNTYFFGPDQKERRVPLTFLIGPDRRVFGHDLSGGDLAAVREGARESRTLPGSGQRRLMPCPPEERSVNSHPGR